MRDHVDHLGQVDQDDTPVMNEHVVGGQIAMRQSEASHAAQRRDQLIPVGHKLRTARADLCEPRCRRPVGVANELEQQLGSRHLDWIRNRQSGLMQPGQRGELGPGPLLRDDRPAGRGPPRHRTVVA
jgi:hypothetical protein